MDGVIKLIKRTITADDLGYPVATENARETFCSVESVTRSEYFQAGKAGLAPAHVFRVNAIEYEGEEEIEYEGQRFRVYRTYKNGLDFMELYTEYRSGVTDPAEPEPAPDPPEPPEPEGPEDPEEDPEEEPTNAEG